MSSSRRNPFSLPELEQPPAVGASLAYTIADPRDTNFDELGSVRVRKVSGGWEVDVTRPGSDAELLRGALTKKVVHKDWARAARAVRMTLEQFRKKGFEVERAEGRFDQMQIARANMASDARKAARASMRAEFGDGWFEDAKLKKEFEKRLRAGGVSGQVAAKIKSAKGPKVAADGRKPKMLSGRASAGADLELVAYRFGKKVGTFKWHDGVATLKVRGAPPESHEIDRPGAFYWMDMMRGAGFDFQSA